MDYNTSVNNVFALIQQICYNYNINWLLARIGGISNVKQRTEKRSPAKQCRRTCKEGNLADHCSMLQGRVRYLLLSEQIPH